MAESDGSDAPASVGIIVVIIVIVVLLLGGAAFVFNRVRGPNLDQAPVMEEVVLPDGREEVAYSVSLDQLEAMAENGERALTELSFSEQVDTQVPPSEILESREELQLTEEQVNELEQIQAEFTPRLADLARQVFEAETQIQSEVVKENPDMSRIESLMQQSGDAYAQLRIAVLQAQDRTLNVLSREQLLMLTDEEI